ncbi:bifunctional phosphatase IMPL2, chloroplastic isoform X2 [Punica granatum]|uniref:Bifunctional phosphatase IMPL2, chloroplastic isoform X2 n=1 Tax=Punica granatum TaxID=22663 RepID=A0A218XGK5_PUNGR|nr:bifunctional phosphatase IMPL2, chloroplastic isoform X2 [Punica granatum]OWM83880.1 hypothetical protein CDL15_Pgr004311 [Punica granatum]
MLTQSRLLSPSPSPKLSLSLFPAVAVPSPSKPSNSSLSFPALIPHPGHCSLKLSPSMASNPTKLSAGNHNQAETVQWGNGKEEEDYDEELDRFAEVANRVADAAGEVIRKYFRKKFEILDKADLSPVTIADQAAEEAMVSVILENFPPHAIYGEENGWRCNEKFSNYVWVLDPIDGTKSFITGKPLFGTLIALLHKGKPILSIIDQPVLRERWIGIKGRTTTLNGVEISTRSCTKLSQAYLYTTSPHLFNGEAEQAFARVRSKVKVPLYGCDCYAYALLASGFVDLVIESGLKVLVVLLPIGMANNFIGRHLLIHMQQVST